MKDDSAKLRQSKILDREVHICGLNTFKSVKQVETGDLVFEMKSGNRYTTPLEYFHQWYSKGPHETVLLEGEGNPNSLAQSELFYDGRGIRLVFANGNSYDVAWDVVLMSLEPRYEHFGGFNEKSQAMTKAYWAKLRNAGTRDRSNGKND